MRRAGDQDGLGMHLAYEKNEPAVKDMISCLLSVYGKGESAVSPRMFDELYVRQSIADQRMDVFVGKDRWGRPQVTASTRRAAHFEKALEICALAAKDGFPGSRLSSAMIGHILHAFAPGQLFYAHAAMFCATEGNAFEDNGFIPTGFLLGVCDARKHLTEPNYNSKKHSWAVYIQCDGHRHVEMVYVPESLRDFVRPIYARLGVAPVILHRAHLSGGSSVIEYGQDDDHKTLTLFVLKSGDDLTGQIGGIRKRYTDELQTDLLYLNICDPGAIVGYRALYACGFRFAGIMPLCGHCEYIILSDTRKVALDFSELVMTEALSKIRDGSVMRCGAGGRNDR